MGKPELNPKPWPRSRPINLLLLASTSVRRTPRRWFSQELLACRGVHVPYYIALYVSLQYLILCCIVVYCIVWYVTVCMVVYSFSYIFRILYSILTLLLLCCAAMLCYSTLYESMLYQILLDQALFHSVFEFYCNITCVYIYIYIFTLC